MKKIVYPILLLGYIVIMVFLSAVPGGLPFSSLDKVYHVIEFFFLTLILLKTLDKYEVKGRYAITLAVGILLAYATEGLQMFIPSRYFSHTDLVADVVGVLLGSLRWKY